jgi:uncharacterized membrane protein (DUF4010 family)
VTAALPAELDAAVRLAIAGLVGLGVGLEREWSGHTTGPNARFAGLRTFLLLGLIGGVAGLLLSESHEGPASVAIAGGIAISIAAYIMAVRRPNVDIDGTTEAAALIVVLLGVLAGERYLALSAGVASVVVLALSEKTRLHWIVRRVNEQELRAALQFAVLALVVLPLLPTGPFWGPIALRPRSLWMIVLLFSGLNFVGFLARRALGPSSGYTLTGLAGGLVSSTAVTLDFSRKSRQEADIARGLAYGVLGACTVLIPRVLIVSAALNTAVAVRLAWFLLPPAILGTAMLLLSRRANNEADHGPSLEVANPLRLGNAIQMAIAFQIAIVLLSLVRERWGTVGMYPAGAILGLTDVDALTVSMSRVDGSVAPAIAARAIAIGILANTLLKLGLTVAMGKDRFRRVASTGLGGLAAASVLGLIIA